MIDFTGERIVPQANNCEPHFAAKMYQEHIARYTFASRFTSGRRVLDVGCGVGYGAQYLAQNGARSVIAFDLSEEAIDHARQYYAHPNVEFITASATDFDFGRRFEVVTCFELIEHVQEQNQVLRLIANALEDDGVLIMSTPRALDQKRTDFHTREFTAAEFRALLAAHFSVVSLYYENNHFSSLVARTMPSRIERILPMQDAYSDDKADYFVAVAAKNIAMTAYVEGAEPVLIVNDEKYVKLLEHDVNVLHEAEHRLSHDVSTLRQSEEQMRRDEQILRAENDRIRRAEQLIQAEYRQLRHDILQLKVDLTSLRATLEPLRIVLSPLRLLWRTARRGYRVLRKVFGYWRLHGAAATWRAIERRLARSEPPASILPPTVDLATLLCESYDVVFMIGCWEGESKRYRVYNLIEGLRSLGYRVLDLPYAELEKLVHLGARAHVVVLFRAPYDESVGTARFLEYARAQSIKVVYDVDDYVFEPSIIDTISGVRTLDRDQLASYRDGVVRYRKLLEQCDLVTVPTAYLQARAEELGVRAAVVPNSVNADQVAAALEFKREPQQNTRLMIGYFSGSRTHQDDFAECDAALHALMVRHPQLVLRLVGYLELDSHWDHLKSRIERIDFQPPRAMLRLLSECEINIAPLQLNNSFCSAKSELKFFEAGLVGVPTVASATETFARAIQHGVDGYCARDSAEWTEALEALIASPELRARIGTAARHTALTRYSAIHAAEQAAAAYGLNAAESPQTEPLASDKLHITWVIPGLIIGGGGHRNILRAAYFLQQFGHRISLYFTGTEQSPTELRALIKQHFYPLDCPIYLYNGALHPADVVFATHWSTVAPALTARGQAKEIMYFVQDFEPHFVPMSTEYVIAENTYRLGLYHITSGPWCEVILRRDFGAVADHFQFPVDRGIYYPRERRKQNLNIVYFAKPEMPRRCFELGVLALREVHRMRPDVEIVMFGSRHLSKQHFDFPVTLRDLVPTLEELAQMYSDGDVGLVFSTTNPSLIPYEMMACGLPVVDLRRGENSVNYGGRDDIAMLADPMPERLAQDIVRLLEDVTQRNRRREAGLAFIDTFPSEEQMARRVEELILARIRAIAELEHVH